MSKNPGQFKDIGKDANDLLNKGYDDYDTKFEINATGLNANVKASFTKNQEKTTGSLEYKTKCEKCGDLTTTLDFGKSIKVQSVSKDKFIQKLDITTELTTSPAKLFDGAKLKLTTDYAHDAATLSNSITYPVSGLDGTTVVTSLVVGSKEHGVVLGGEVELSSTRGQLTRGDAALGYKKGSFAVTLFSKSTRDNSTNALNHKLGGNFHYRVAEPSRLPINQLALETIYNPKASNLDISIAASAKPDATSTVKAKVNSNGNINVAFNKDLEKPLSVGVFAATSFHSVSDVKFGLKLAYSQ